MLEFFAQLGDAVTPIAIAWLAYELTGIKQRLERVESVFFEKKNGKRARNEARTEV